MSENKIYYTTQIGQQAASQVGHRIVFIHDAKMTERQSALMKEARDCFKGYLGVVFTPAHELDLLPPSTRFFVIPSAKEDLLRRIKGRFEKPVIFLPRAIIETRGLRCVNLPIRSLCISATMYDCRVFLVKSCDVQTIRNRINEMAGTVVPSFEAEPNVVITDRADSKYCSKATKKGIPVVTRAWIDDSYKIAAEEESSFFIHNAMTSMRDYLVKPFYGLYIKIRIKNANPQIKRAITDNQGHVIYGDENGLTHIIGSLNYYDTCVRNLNQRVGSKLASKVKEIDLEYFKACLDLGFHMTDNEYIQFKNGTYEPAQVKIESQPVGMETEENTAPLSRLEGITALSDNNHMPPPPSVHPQSSRQAPDTVCNDMILRALSSMDSQQTQHVSTQMRGLPDSELRIEQTMEPSQQLIWNEANCSRGN